ncbi:hypothetical protein KBD33_03250 [Candidatus Gracilibacteria bacterium]|nr:hypothetical protein [Candidatus Gracilibacteria bacterium]
MIIITRVFRKEMRGFSGDILEEIFLLLKKYHRGLSSNLFQIQEFGKYIILKGYLQGKAVRMIVAKRENSIYIPIALYKKESKIGYNIRFNFDVHGHMDRMEKCIQNDEFETFDIK